MRYKAAMAILIIGAALAAVGGCGSDTPSTADVTGVWNGTLTQGHATFNVRLTLTQAGLDVTGTYQNLTLIESTDVTGTYFSPDMTLLGAGTRLDFSVGTNAMNGRIEDARGVGSLDLSR
jgi:hypothetical protein